MRELDERDEDVREDETLLLVREEDESELPVEDRLELLEDRLEPGLETLLAGELTELLETLCASELAGSANTRKADRGIRRFLIVTIVDDSRGVL